MENADWATPEEIWGEGKFGLFKNDVSPADLEQGSMGDCFFLAAVSAMAERPELLKPLFKEKEVTDNMFYTINLFIEGVETPVTIDKKLPTY